MGEKTSQFSVLKEKEGARLSPGYFSHNIKSHKTNIYNKNKARFTPA
jgi:hypothetical protein